MAGQQAIAAVGTDRDDLHRLAGQFVQAQLANDGSRLPRTPSFRYTENGQELKIGDGLWGTLSAYAGQDPELAPAAAGLPYDLTVADRASAQIVRILSIDENGTRGVLALRLKLDPEAIAEAEALAVREEFSGERAGTVTLFQPRLPVMLDGAHIEPADALFGQVQAMDADDMIAAANRYFDAIEKGSSDGVPFSDDCMRRDNGVRTSDKPDAPALDPAQPGFRPFALGCGPLIDSGFYSYVGKIRERRFVAEPERGLLAAFHMIDNPGVRRSFEAAGVGTVDYPGPRASPDGAGAGLFNTGLAAANMIAPSTAQSVAVLKFIDGEIARIDSFARAAPYKIRSGWPDV
jgi:hypothetical protein